MPCEKTVRRGITASKFRVNMDDAPKKHRHLSHILQMIDAAPLSARAKGNASAVFEKLGQAEAQVHGVPDRKGPLSRSGRGGFDRRYRGRVRRAGSAGRGGSARLGDQRGQRDGGDRARHSAGSGSGDGATADRDAGVCARSGDGVDDADRSGDRGDSRRELRTAAGHAHRAASGTARGIAIFRSRPTCCAR